MNEPPVFDKAVYERLNLVRAQVIKGLLNELRPSLPLRTAGDIGCGLGFFSDILNSCGYQVTGVDGRVENVATAQSRYPQIQFLTGNVEDLQPLGLGRFDLVLCLGLLYHLENPFSAIRNLHAITSEVLVVESMCAPGENATMELLDEASERDQGLNYIAFYPTENCLVKMLYRSGFQSVYGLRVQPDDPDYQTTRHRIRPRTFLVAAKHPLKTAQLRLIAEPSRAWDIWSVAVDSPRSKLAGYVRRLLASGVQAKKEARSG